MSKQSKTGLTGSRKKARRRKRTVKVVDALDGLEACYHKLAALAGLMDACGEAMEAYQVRGLGILVTEEVHHLGELKTTLNEETR
jgi:hypothetical protein